MNTDGIIALAARVRARANEIIAQELRQRGVLGLVPSHGAILHHLFLQEGPLPMGRLAQLIGRKKNTVTTLVRKLEKHGYVERQPDPTDSRVSLVGLTPQGAAFRNYLDEISEMLLSRVWGHMPLAERQALVAGLEKILANLG
jgi:DNA-binding MarR family transcriptional regulator